MTSPNCDLPLADSELTTPVCEGGVVGGVVGVGGVGGGVDDGGLVVGVVGEVGVVVGGSGVGGAWCWWPFLFCDS